MINIPLMKVHIPPKEKLMPELEKVLYSGMLTEGKKVIEFERAFQEKFNLSRRLLSTNSCTAALQLAYRCANVKNKIVLATPMTCTATNMPIFAEGGKIVWCDIDPATGNISTSDVREKIKKYGEENIAAISFVDFAGYPADLTNLAEINYTSRRHLYHPALVQDAAQSLGAKWNGHYIGTHSHIKYVAFSFQAIKQLTTVDGGGLAINTAPNELYPRDVEWKFIKQLKWYGIDREAVKEAVRWHYDIEHWGYKFHMNNVNATIGLAQLDYIDDVISRHKENGKWFDDKLASVSGVKTMKIPNQSEPSYWIYMVKVERREEFAKMMTAAGVGINVAHVRNDQYTCFKDPNLVLNVDDERPGLEEFNDKYIAIPCGWWVTNEDREYIVETIKKGW